MSDKRYEAMQRIKIPSAMKQAALDAAGQTVKGSPWQEIAEAAVRGALCWLGKNPIVPTMDQAKSLRDLAINVSDSYDQEQPTAASETAVVIEWQRRMFLAPEQPQPTEPPTIQPQWRIWTKTGDKVLLQAPGEVIVRRLEGMIEFARPEDLIPLPEWPGDEPAAEKMAALDAENLKHTTGIGSGGIRWFQSSEQAPSGWPAVVEPEEVADLLYDETFKDAWRGVNDAIKEAYRRGQLNPIPK